MDSEQVDAGPSGFLDIFRSDDAASDDVTPDVQSDAAPDAEAAADTSAPDDFEPELSAEERVAASLAASLEADGIEIPEPGAEAEAEDDDESPLRADDETDLDRLTPAELRALAEEAIALRAQTRESDRTVVAQKVQEAEAQALRSVQEQFQREVLSISEQHYGAELERRLDQLDADADRADNPAEYKRARRGAIVRHVQQAKDAWEAAQAAEWEPRVTAATSAARKSVPELRRVYAEHLAQERNLPSKAVDEILKTRDADDFVARADELVQYRDALAKERSRHQQSVRVEANKRLAATTVRPPASGRARGKTPVAYRGSAEEGASILALMHK